ncbi:cytochrome c oxidase assembly factor 5-like [Ctenocephalides felis]|uniref:cytochrome c oxidase assembly factor 5-like n=1 Tax=Ctenocephalides felis TaxID=7515 RepID=UPI000E6E5827|nr:cytochrome c oxidase assembly factor 5-like [Ctenocephalides felis]XP_026478470.1 cytochrome c oxidase assembly factor 5-like [Ctenocephalides felis]
MMQYEEENERLADKTACAGLRADLKMCLLKSECCKDRKNTPRECLNKRDGTVPEECFVLREAFFQCKRSILDNRQRFRGRKGY